MKKCINCNSNIKSPNKKLILTDRENNEMYTCCEECKQQIEKFQKKRGFYLLISMTEIALGILAAVLLALRKPIIAEIALTLDAFLMIIFAGAGFRSNKENISLDKFKKQNRICGAIIVAMIIAVYVMSIRK